MMDYYWMISRNLVEIVPVELPLVLHFGVIEEISIDPKARRSFLSLRAEFICDAGNGDKLYLIRIAYDDLVKQNVSRCVIMAVNESGDDRHLLCIERPRSLAAEYFCSCGAPHKDESPALHRKCLRFRHTCIDGVHLSVVYDQIRVARIGVGAPRISGNSRVQKTATREAGHTEPGQAEKFSAIMAVLLHPSSSALFG